MGLFNIRVMGLEMCIFQGKPLELVHDNPPLRQGLRDMDFPLPRLKKLWGYLILENDFQLVGGLEHVLFSHILGIIIPYIG
jgi:hypothetical protein